LIKIEGNDSSSAFQKAKDILAEIKKGGDFSELAQKNSQDPGSAPKGGDLGWFGKGRMVKEFETAAFKAKAGQVVGPVKSAFGYHIIKVTGKDSREVKIADLFRSITMSSQTREAILAQAEDLSAQAKKYGDLEAIAKQLNYTVSETPSFQKDGLIPGIGVNASVNKFAFTQKKGDVSNALPVTKGYGVFMISDLREAGVRPFEEVKNAIEVRVKREKKMAKVKERAMAARKLLEQTDNLQKVTTTYPDVSVQHLAPTIVSGFIPGIGRDFGFVGGITALNVGQLSQPVEGSRGYYLIKLISKTAFDSTMYNAQKENLRNQLLSERRKKIVSEWLENLKKNSDIIDNRDLFYR